MLDFRQTSERHNPPGILGRRWLVAFVLLLGVGFILFEIGRRPGAWQWLVRLAERSQDLPPEGIDNRLPAGRQDELARDSFIISTPEPEDAESDRRRDAFPGVDPDLLDSIRDDTFFSRADQEPSLHLLDVLARTDERTLRGASTGQATYAQLFRQPAHYRGRVVTISGVARRAERIELPENKHGIGHYFKVWLFPKIHPPSPVIVFALDLPPAFPVGEKISAEAEATGFFYKRCAYQSADGLRTAPTILSKTLQWEKPSPIVEKPAIDGRRLLFVAIVAALLAGLMAWYVYLRTRPSRPHWAEQPPNFDVLNEMDKRNETGEES